MANKNKKKDAAAQQKAAAAYMSKKTAPVQKVQPHKAAAPKAEPTEENKVKTEPTEENKVKAEPLQENKVKTVSAKVKPAQPEKPKAETAANARPKAASASKPRAKRKKEPLKLSELRWDRIFAVVLVFCVLVAGVTALIFWLSTRFTVSDDMIFEYRGTNYSVNDLYEIQEDAVEQSRLAGEMKRKGDVDLFE